jgi:hypothetical protein
LFLQGSERLCCSNSVLFCVCCTALTCVSKLSGCKWYRLKSKCDNGKSVTSTDSTACSEHRANCLCQALQGVGPAET